MRVRVCWSCWRGCQSGFAAIQAWPRAASSKSALAVGETSCLKEGGGGSRLLSGTAIQGSYGGGAGSFDPWPGGGPGGGWKSDVVDEAPGGGPGGGRYSWSYWDGFLSDQVGGGPGGGWYEGGCSFWLGC